MSAARGSDKPDPTQPIDFGDTIFESLTEEECYLHAVLSDESGLDQAELLWRDTGNDDGCYRAMPFQWAWWRDQSERQVDQAGRSLGKSERIMARALAFPYNHPGQEHLITGPQGIHVSLITDRIETRIFDTRFYEEQIINGRSGVTHRPFHAKWKSGAHTITRLPQATGLGLKGCVAASAMVLTARGLVRADQVEVGDMVWGHTCRWVKVLRADSYEEPAAWRISGHGAPPLVVSEIHRLLVRERIARVAERGRSPFGSPYWESADTIAAEPESFAWCAPATFTPTRSVVMQPVVDPQPVTVDLDDVFPVPWLFLSNQRRAELLAGLLKLGYVGREVATGTALMAHSLGQPIEWVAGENDHWLIRPSTVTPAVDGPFAAYPITDVDQVDGTVTVHNLITESNSFLADGIYHHNTHPTIVDIDEAQDFPPLAYKEMPEIVREDIPGNMTILHGVSKGVRDHFYDVSTKPDMGYRVHRLCLPGDSLVYTPRGPIEAGSVKEGDEVYSVTGWPTLTTAPVTGWAPNEVSELWSVVTRARSIRLTGNHPILCIANDKTRRTRERLKFEWRRADDIAVGDFICVFSKGLGLGTISEPPPREVLLEQMNVHSPYRDVPEWVWTATPATQMAFLHGYLIADGSLAKQKRGQNPLAVRASSYELVRHLRVLALELGLRVTKLATHLDERTTPIRSNHAAHMFSIYVGDADFRQIPTACIQIQDRNPIFLDEHLSIQTVLGVGPTGEFTETFDIEVAGNESFIAEGVVVHNTKMHRPDFGPEDREKSIRDYGSEESPDYLRNVLGEHANSQNRIFNLDSLMKSMDEEFTEYSQHEYVMRRLRPDLIEAKVQELGGDGPLEESASELHVAALLDLLEFNADHLLNYERFYGGADIGLVSDPTEIIVAAEYLPTDEQRKADRDKALALPAKGLSQLKVLMRVNAVNIPAWMQEELVMQIITFYRGMASFSMDATGPGQPIFQGLQRRAGIERAALFLDYSEEEPPTPQPEAEEALTIIKGYNFGAKAVVGLDERKAKEMEGADPEEVIRKAGIKRYVKDAATDELRNLVERGRWRMPHDTEMLDSMNGQTWAVGQEPIGPYGEQRRIYNTGKFHILDGCRMLVLGRALEPLEQFARTKPIVKPVLDRF